MVKGIVEKTRISGISIGELINPSFLEKIKKQGIEIIPFLLSFDVNSQEGKSVVTLNHYNPKEFVEKIIHLDSPDLNKLDKLIDVICSMGEQNGRKDE